MIRKLSATIFGVICLHLIFFSFLKDFSNRFVIPFPGTIGFFALVLTSQIFLFWGVKRRSINPRNYYFAAISSIVALISSFLSIFRSSFVDIVLLSMLSISLTFISSYLLTITYPFVGAVSEFFIMPIILFFNWLISFTKTIDTIPSVLKSVFSKLKRDSNKSKVLYKGNLFSSIGRGLIIAVPVVGMVVILLSSADPVFSKLISDLFAIKLPTFPEWIVVRLLATLVFLGILIPATLTRIETRFRSYLNNKAFSKFKIEATTVVGILVAVFAVFLFIQFRYLFAAVKETDLIQFGVHTYSEYVRKGFLELTVVSIITYLTVGGSLVIFRNSERNHKLLKTLNLVLLGEVMIFIISILRRVYLYQIAHGLTRVRVYGSGFLILLLALTVILVLRHVREKRNWYLYELGSLVAIVLIFTNISVDKLIANTFRPTVNGEIDYVYISKLSPDAVDGWIESYNHAKKDIDELAAKPLGSLNPGEIRRAVYAGWIINNLQDNYLSLIDRYDSPNTPFSDGKHINFGDSEAYVGLKREVSYADLTNYKNKISTVLQVVPVEQRYQNIDRSQDTPLLR